MHLYFGRKAQLPGYHFSTEDYESFQVIFVATGKVDMTVHKTVTAVFPGGVLILPIASAFRLSCSSRGKGYTGVCAILSNNQNGSMSDQAASDYRGTAQAVLSTAPFRQLSEILAAQMRDPGFDSQILLDSLARSFLELGRRLALDQINTENRNESAEYWVDRTARIIETSIYSNRRVTDLLADVGLSYRQLTRHFQIVKKMTPKQYQLHCRLNEAQRLLAGTGHSISSIALDLGFASSQHFATAFRQSCDCTPSAYREGFVPPGPAP